MAISDPVADMLTRIRNAVLVRHDSVLVPTSKTKVAIAKVLKEEGFINDFEIVKEKTYRSIKINLKYLDKNTPALNRLERVSKPGLRVYADRTEIPRIAAGMGVAILSTSKGVMTGQQAWKQGIGGEVLCYVL
ncbi:MAG TPA: 30S ribosomal protein S8 [Dehalococcoidales bacterium]|nr:30S ribosomal protein S8 [Dehalococcoidales bacterium]